MLWKHRGVQRGRTGAGGEKEGGGNKASEAEDRGVTARSWSTTLGHVKPPQAELFASSHESRLRFSLSLPTLSTRKRELD